MDKGLPKCGRIQQTVEGSVSEITTDPKEIVASVITKRIKCGRFSVEERTVLF